MPSLGSVLKAKLTGKSRSKAATSSLSPHWDPSSSQTRQMNSQDSLADPPPSYSPYDSATPAPAQSPRPRHKHVQSSASSRLNGDHDERDESTLKLFDTIFVIDDSGSMSAERRWHDTKEALKHITPICTKWDSNGIDVYFLNRPQVYRNVTDANDVTSIFEDYRKEDLRGSTLIAKRLSDILGPYLRQYRKDPDSQKPLNIICITDGKPTDEPDAYIRYIAEELDELRAVPWQIGIQFLQVGSSRAAQDYLEGLDDNLHTAKEGEKKCRDMVDTTHYGKMGQYKNFSDALSKILIGGVNKRWDAKNPSPG